MKFKFKIKMYLTVFLVVPHHFPGQRWAKYDDFLSCKFMCVEDDFCVYVGLLQSVSCMWKALPVKPNNIINYSACRNQIHL
jgi:hypothetical protein